VIWAGQGGSGSGSSLIIINFLSDLDDPNLQVLGQLVFVDEIKEIRYYNGSA
jgi:hypothetical protein